MSRTGTVLEHVRALALAQTTHGLDSTAETY